MFFTDSTGFFSLICLLIQCGMAWIFAAFFGALAGQHGWLRALQAAFVGLAIGLTALCVRFTLAYNAVAGTQPMQEGDVAVRLLYGLYLAGKVVFAIFLLRGVTILSGGAVGGRRRWAGAAIALAFAAGCVLPTAESMLLVQAPWFAVVCSRAAQVMRRSRLAIDDPWRRVVVRALAVTAGVWLLYATAVVVVGPLHPAAVSPWIEVLRLNSLVDLVLQAVLAISLIVVAVNDAHRASFELAIERDRLRDQVQRDERLRALSTLVSGVAHEINNPLTAILGFAEELGDVDPTVRERAAVVVREQAERCRAIVQRMSLLGRRSTMRVAAIDVPASLRRVARGFEPELQRRRVALRLDVPRDVPAFAADPTGVEQVVTNLVANALQASPPDTAITLAVRASVDGLVFVVSDRGPGVPVADRVRIFEPFWTTKREGQGTGLGLAMVDAILRSHGARIEVDDAPGGGARFTVYWPSAERTGGEPAAPPTPFPGTVRTPIGNRLLVVDDEPLVRATIARQVRGDGWQVEEAGSAERALELLLAPGASFDAIVCDLRMPGMSGASLYDELGARAPHWLPRLLFLTGDLASVDAVRFAERCRQPIMTKPFTAGELLRRLRDVAQTA